MRSFLPRRDAHRNEQERARQAELQGQARLEAGNRFTAAERSGHAYDSLRQAAGLLAEIAADGRPYDLTIVSCDERVIRAALEISADDGTHVPFQIDGVSDRHGYSSGASVSLIHAEESVAGLRLEYINHCLSETLPSVRGQQAFVDRAAVAAAVEREIDRFATRPEIGAVTETQTLAAGSDEIAPDTRESFEAETERICRERGWGQLPPNAGDYM